MNPLLLRLLRQEVRNRAFLGVYLTLLLAGAVTTLLVATTHDGERPGQVLALVLFGAATGVLWMYQPLTAYRAMVREREDDTWDLLELTGLTPSRIARGILTTALVQGLFFLGALAPFLAAAYLLRGLDLVTLLVVSGGILAGGLSLGAFATLLGCLGRNRASRMGLASILTIGLLILWIWSLPIAYMIVDQALLAGGSPHAWLVTSLILAHILLVGWVFLVLARTLMTHRAEDRSSGPRIMALVIAVDLAVLPGLTSLAVSSSSTSQAEAWVIGGLLATGWALLAGACAVAEDRTLSHRQARVLLDATGWRRLVRPVTGPGAARGAVFLAVALVPGLAAALIGNLIEASRGDEAQGVALLAGYGLGYLALGDVVGRTLLRGGAATPMARRLCTAAVVIAGALGTAIIATVTSLQSVLVFSPFFGPFAETLSRHHDLDLAWARTLAVGGAVLGAIWFGTRAKAAWTPRTQAVYAGAADRNPRGGR